MSDSRRSIIKDAEYEMMCELQFTDWAAKPCHGGLNPIAASAEFKTRCAAIGAVTDLLGENPDYRQRCAIKVRDVVRDRDVKSFRQSYTEQENKQKFTEELRNSLLARLAMGFKAYRSER